jgi:hypothetical protein
VTGQARPLRYRIAFFATAAVALSVVVTLPFSVKSVVDDVLGPATGRVIQITVPGVGQPIEPEVLRERTRTHTRLHLAFVSIDEVHLQATIRVSGHHRCVDCAFSHRVRIVAIAADDHEAEGLPPSAAVTLAPTDMVVSETIHLPLRGHPIHYPFDRYEMTLGIAYQRLFPDGRREPIGAGEADDRLFLSVQELLPRSMMVGPFPVDHHRASSADDPLAYTQAFGVSFQRPPYVRVLAVMLVVLIAAAAVYSVVLRPLHDLVVNAGALVLGVWGIRSILTPPNILYITAVDLALSMVIIFLLGALTVRALLFVHDVAELRLLGRRPPRGGSERSPSGSGEPAKRESRS